MKNKVAFLVPYFGELPSYFHTFIQTVANKKLDIIFFTDCAKPFSLPSNIIWNKYSLKEIRNLMTEKLQQPVALSVPYKLCDLKPSLGLVFQDYITDYEFWGSIDLDVCLGNFDKYFNVATFESFDIFSGIKEYLSGSIFIVRNNNYCNSIFKLSKDWQTVFRTDKYFGFDECGGQYFHALKSGKTFEEIAPPIESFTEVLFKQSQNGLRLAFDNVIAEPNYDYTIVENNSVIYNKQEFLLVHFIRYKVWYFFYTGKKVTFPFYINRRGIFQHKPTYLTVFFSKNFWIGLKKKIEININKLRKDV